jgi:protein-L-isoaspartate(D-aspartate) O-methyltransferase
MFGGQAQGKSGHFALSPGASAAKESPPVNRQDHVMTEFAAARTKMVDSQLKTEGVTDYNVLAAMGEIPRERFVPVKLRPLAYIDEDLPVKEATGGRPARYLMEPAPLARLLQAALVGPDDNVLVVGGGTGYSAAVLSRLAHSVLVIESDAALAAQASANLSELGAANVKVVAGPLEQGFADAGPYDDILVDGSIETVPDTLFGQLKEGGRLVAVVGYGRSAQAKVFTKTDGDVAARAVFDADVRPLPGFQKPKAFVF